MIAARIIVVLIGYACGIFLTGFVYGKSKHVDLRKVGSGNVGTTNTMRNLGFRAGVITLLGDVSKCIAAVFLAWLIFHERYPQQVRVLELYAGLGAILGHNFPVNMKFKGGKGIACTGGLLLAFCPFEVPVCLVLFVGAVAITRYVSLGSILVVISFFIQTLIFGQLGYFGVTGSNLIEIYILSGIIMVMGVLRHRSNIGRLVTGTENRFSFNFKKEQ